MTGVRVFLLVIAISSGFLAVALLCGEGRAVLAFFRAAWEAAVLGAVLAFGTEGLGSLMSSVVAVVLP